MTPPTHSLDYLSRYFGNEAVARSLLRKLGFTPDPSTRYTEETLQAMRRLRDQPSVAVPPPTIWLSLEAAGEELGMEPGKVYTLAARGELVGDLASRWTESRVERSSVFAYRPAPAPVPVEAPQVPQVKHEPVELPSPPVLELEEASRPFWSRRRADAAREKGFKGVNRV